MGVPKYFRKAISCLTFCSQVKSVMNKIVGNFDIEESYSTHISVQMSGLKLT